MINTFFKEIKQRTVDVLIIKTFKIISSRDIYKNTALHYACHPNYNIKDRIELIKFLIDKVNVNAQNDNQETALHILLRNEFNLSEILKLFKNANFNLKDFTGKTPFHLILEKIDDPEYIKDLVKKGAKTSIKDNVGNNGFHFAKPFNFVMLYKIIKNSNKLIEETNKEGIRPLDLISPEEFNKKGKNGETPILVALELIDDDVGLYKIYLKAVIDISTKDNFDNNVLHYLFKNKNIEIIKEIYNDITEKSERERLLGEKNKKGLIPFLLFCKIKDDTNLFDLILSDVSDAEVKDSEKNNYLHLSIKNGNLKIANKLIDEYYSHDKLIEKNDTEETPFYYAFKYLHYDIHKVFLQKLINRIKVNDMLETFENGDNILHLLMRNPNRELILSVIKKNDILNQKNDFGVTPLHLSFEYIENFTFMIKDIIPKGDVTLKDEDENTIFHYAAYGYNKTKDLTLLKYMINVLKLKSLSGERNKDDENIYDWIDEKLFEEQVEIFEKEDEINDLKKIIKVKDEQYSKLNTEYKRIVEDNKELVKKNSTLKLGNKNRDIKIGILEKENKSLTKTITIIRSKNLDLTKKKEINKNELKKIKKKNKKLIGDKKITDDENKELKKLSTKFSIEIDKLKERLEIATQHNNKLTLKQENLEKKSEQFEKENIILKKENKLIKDFFQDTIKKLADNLDDCEIISDKISNVERLEKLGVESKENIKNLNKELLECHMKFKKYFIDIYDKLPKELKTAKISEKIINLFK